MALTPRYTIKTPGFTENGSDQTPVPGNAIQMGKLRGFVNPFSCTIVWDFVDDDNEDSVGGVCEFRRQGTTTWYNAPDMKRVQSTSAIGGTDVKAYGTKLIGLAPNTTYDVRCSVSDPDGGSVSNRTTTFTTRRVPRVPSNDGDAHVVTTDAEYSTAITNAQGSEPIYLRASGSPYTSPALSGKMQNGSYDDPLFVTTYPGDAKVTLDQASFQDTGNDHVWLDNISISNRIRSEVAGEGDGLIVTRVDSLNNSTSKPFQILVKNVFSADCEWSRSTTQDGDLIEHAEFSQNVTLIFQDLSTGFDGFSKGGTTPAANLADHMNIDWLFSVLTDIEDDVFEHDNMLHGMCVGYCLAGPNIGRTGISFQDMLTGWCYHYHTQMTGLRTYQSIKHQFKQPSNKSLMWNVNQTWIVGSDSNNKGKGQQFLFGEVSDPGAPDTEGTVFCNMAWGDEENAQAGLQGVTITVPGDSLFSLPRLIDGNLYDADDPWDGLTLAQMQTEGHDANSSKLTLSSTQYDNYPADRNVGTGSPMWPVSGQAADGAGVTGVGVNGIEPFIGPFHGSTPDVGAFQRLIKWPAGLRQTTGFGGTEIKQAFVLPSNMTLRDTANAHDSQYTALGLPSSVSSFGYVRLLMDRDGPTTPTTALTIQFVRWAEADVWDEYLSFLDGEVGDTIDRKWRLEGGDGMGYIRHGLGVTKLTRGNDTLILAAAIEDGGLAQMTWGVTTSDITTTPTLERDAWEVAYSLYGEWGEVEQGAFSPSSAGAFVPMAMA